MLQTIECTDNHFGSFAGLMDFSYLSHRYESPGMACMEFTELHDTLYTAHNLQVYITTFSSYAPSSTYRNAQR